MSLLIGLMVAKRMEDVEGSPTVRLTGLVAELKAKGVQVISLAIGEPDFPTPPHIVQAAKEALDQGFTKYTPSKGIPELREAIADKSSRENSIPCTADDVLVSSSKHLIFSTLLAMTGEGDEVILPDPGWVSYLPMVQIAGARPVPVPCRSGEGFQMTPDAVQERITPQTKLLLLNSPNNPTGSVYSRETLQGILDLAVDHEFLILTDEIYEKMVYEGRHHSIASFPEGFERTITVNGFSKTYSMTGWRLGWAVAPKELLEPMTTVQEHSVTCATSFAQRGGVAALRGPQKPVEDMVASFRGRRDLIVGGLNEIPSLQCLEPQGTFYAWVKFRGPWTSYEFSEMLLQKAGIAVTPGRAFGDEGEGYVRVSFATSEQNLKRALESLGRILA